MNLITLTGIVGICACLYAIYVERNTKRNKTYTAFCDINDYMSCSMVLKSPYSRLTKMAFGLSDNSMFNVPNTYYGVLFYIAITIYPIYPFTLIPFRETLLFMASIASLLLCCILAYILYFKLNNFCAICVATYFINIAIFLLAYKEINA